MAVKSKRKTPKLREEQARSVELLWRDGRRASRGRKPLLSTEQIAHAAIRLADAEGLAAVSMQRLAAEFGFTTMSLYRYVPGKIELIDLMLDVALGPAPTLDARASWRTRLEAWARTMSARFHAHPWGLEVVNRLRLPGPNELAWMEVGARCLEGTRLAGEDVLDALFVITGQVRVAAQYSTERPRNATMSSEEYAFGIARLIEERKADHPTLATALQKGAFGDEAVEGDLLLFGLERMLDGIEALIERRARVARRR